MAIDLGSAEHLRWERDAIARARAGSEAAWRSIYDRFAPSLYASVLAPRTGDADAAADALGATFRAAWRNLGRFEDRGRSIWFWLVRIAVNESMEQHRRRARQARLLESVAGLMGPLADADNPLEAVEARLEARALQARVRGVMERIHARYALAIELRFFEERSREEAAAAMDVKLGTFDVVLLRALRAFRAEWERSEAATQRD